MVAVETIEVEVAYARPDKQMILKVQGEVGMTVCEAVDRSNITGPFPEIDLETVKMGIFGKAVKPDVVLQAGDRVEIYRPLIADPKTARKRRAEKEKG